MHRLTCIVPQWVDRPIRELVISSGYFTSATSDLELGLGVGAAGGTETFADVLAAVLLLDGVDDQRSFVRHHHASVILVRKHQHLQCRTTTNPPHNRTVCCTAESEFKKKQEVFEKCWAHSLLRAAVTLPVTRCR